MSYSDKINSLPLEVQQAKGKGLTISYSEASEIDLCSLKWDFHRNKKLEGKPPSRALLLGTFFDLLVERKGWWKAGEAIGLHPSDATVVFDRYAQYSGTCLQPNDQFQFPVYAELPNGGWFFGFIDMIRIRDNHVVLLVDQKFSEQPWNENKVKYYHAQAQCYMWALQRMGYESVKEFHFHVCNAVTEEIQDIKYKPNQKTLDKVPDWLVECINKRSEIPQPNGGEHCKWCDWNELCDKLLWGSKE